MKLILSLLVIALAGLASADVYMHNMRGSNNRLNGRGTNRANNNRLCDTQNNAKGGYCWGPSMEYYVGSLLPIEWTNQHGCGDAHDRLDCQLVLQYMCGDNQVRDGATTGRIPLDENTFNNAAAANNELGAEYEFGMHETYHYYKRCAARSRNKGLFTADRTVGAAATRTRQNPNGGRSGFECPEERDYYPYWHPTPWKDIAVLTSDPDRCDYYKQNSQNVLNKGNCSKPEHNNEAECTADGATWSMVGAWNIPAPDCIGAPFSRQNHLGNGVGGEANTYNWTIPNDVSDNCVLRLRYNISTQDKDGRDYWSLTSADNKENSPVKQDPYVWHAGKELRLAINTNQFGRTFQDRSHVFKIAARPGNVPANARIFNLNVRGKRGNIVQAYPAVEYDFAPSRLHVKNGDYVHFQWTGCDTNPNGNDGEGTRGTDRSNIVLMSESQYSYPTVQGNQEPATYAEAEQIYPGDEGSSTQFLPSLAKVQELAHIGQTDCLTHTQLQDANPTPNLDEDVRNCAKLNKGPAYFNGGAVAITRTGAFRYMSSRNNNFSNRAQKGSLISDALVDTFGAVIIGVSSAAFAAAIVVAVIIKVAPGSGVATAAVGA